MHVDPPFAKSDPVAIRMIHQQDGNRQEFHFFNSRPVLSYANP